MRNFKLILISILIVLGLSSCDKANPLDQILPYTNVNFSINPSSIQFDNLNINGNYAYVTGGLRGIIIYNVGFGEYRAFERTSTYHYPNDFECRVSVDESSFFAVDQCSGSKYSLLDGMPYEGPATLPLKQYKTQFDGYELHVWN